MNDVLLQIYIPDEIGKFLPVWILGTGSLNTDILSLFKRTRMSKTKKHHTEIGLRAA
jgi:hypothetical protein